MNRDRSSGIQLTLVPDLIPTNQIVLVDLKRRQSIKKRER